MAEGDDIAIIGAGCRFPGADNLDEFWRVLVNGENHVKDIPPERWKTEAFYSEDKDAPGKIYVKKAGLIKGYDEFDPGLFGISDVEAERIDPQQRFVLECFHMALEDAGIPRAEISGSQTGVYIGCMNDDYKGTFKGNHAEDTSYSSTGFTPSVVSARLSYVYNLQGPCLAVDTACSSALIAVHLGIQAILAGDCEMAVCGGVNCIISPETFIPLCRARMMSAVGQCQAFCDTADGYARGEGCGVIILRKLDQAMKDGNKIWAVVKTGSNQDGRTVQPITSPSGEQQYRLLEKLYSASGIDAASIQYIEAHGTGTPAGDPVEIKTLGSFFTKQRKQGKNTEKIQVGSVKTNIGHTESAAGVAGLIKILLMMKYGKIVPSLHLKQDKSNLNPAIKLEEYDADISTEVKDWKPNSDGERVGCVNSFGFGGSNAHAILVQKEAFEHSMKNVDEEHTDNPLFVSLSARDVNALQATLDKFKHDIQISSDSLRSISYTSAYRRDHLRHRVCFAARSLSELKTQVKGKLLKDKKPGLPMNVVFVYCGVGTTWKGMCSELVKTDKAFREAIEMVDKYFQPLAGTSVLTKLADRTSDYSDPFLNHVAIFATQVGLTEMWRSLGIKPDVIVGQSVGEVAAAYAAGSLDLENAVKVIYYRSKLLAECTDGSMMVVKNLKVTEIEQICDYYGGKVTVAVYSSPVACTLSGETEIMTKVEADVKRISKERSIDIFVRYIPVQCAYHCHMVNSCLPKIKESLKLLEPNVPHTNIISTVTGTNAENGDFQSEDYWARNIREPVLLHKAILSSSKDNEKNIFVEIGPKPILRAHISDIFEGSTTICLPSMSYEKELESKSTAIVELYENGATINWIYDQNISQRASIPTYCFSRKKVLHIPDVERKFFQGLSLSSTGDHMFVQTSVKEGCDFQVMIGNRTTPFVFDHLMSGTALVPGATYVEAAVAICRKYFKLPVQHFAVSVEFKNTLTPKEGKEIEIGCKLNETINGLEIIFSKEKRILCVAHGSKQTETCRKFLKINALKRRCTVQLSKTEVYASLEKITFQYGPSMSLVQSAWCTETECLAELVIPPTVIEESDKTYIHPAVLDSVFQVFGVLKGTEKFSKPVLPKGLCEITVTGQPKPRMFCFAVSVGSFNKQTHFNAVLVDVNGSIICEIKDFFAQEIGTEYGSDSLAYSLEWHLLTTKDEERNMETFEKNLLIWCTEASKPFLQYACEGFMTELLELNLKGKDPSFTFEDKLKNVKEKRTHAVLFVPFADFDLTSSTTKNAYCISKNTILSLKYLLLALNKRSLNIPLFVITKNTQVTQVHQSTSSLYGSELWGLVRCAVHESIYPDIRLVDLDPANCDKVSFVKVLNNCFPCESELRLEGNLVLTNKLKTKRMFTTSMGQKRIYLDNEDVAQVKSSLPGEVVALSYHQNANKTKPISSKDLLQLRLTSFCVHSSAIYPVTSEDHDEKHFVWPELSQEGFQVLSLEGAGFEQVVEGSESKLKSKLCFYCCPINVSTYVDIPRKFVFQQSELFSYIPGLLTSSVILANLSEAVVGASVVCIYADEEIKYSHRIVQLFLETQGKCSVCFVSHSEGVKQIRRLEQEGIQCLIVLSEVERQDIRCLLNSLIKVKQIVSTSNFLSKDVQRWLAEVFPKISVSCLSSESFFSEERLSSIMPIIRDVLTRFNDQICLDKRLSKETHNSYQVNPLAIPVNQESIHNKNKPSFVLKEMMLFKQKGCYIVIGGLTGLGWLIMQWISRNGGGYLRSISRRKPTVDQQNDINRLMNETKCCIKTIQADISDLSSVKAVIKDLEVKLDKIKIKGIFNGAGVLADCLLVNMSEEQLEKVIQPKILGSLNLHIATEHLELDFFVMHSSIASILGNVGQCSYGAGNSFIDALAHYRRSRNLAAQTINWGPLSVGMLKDNHGIESQLEKKGMSVLQPNDICQCLKHVVMTDDAQITFGSFNWSLIGENFASDKLDDLVPKRFNEQRPNKDKGMLEFELENYLKSTDNEKDASLFEIVRDAICRVVTISEKSSLSLATEIGKLGVDSIAAMSFINDIMDLTGCRIPIQVVLSEDTTIQKIVSFLKENILAGISQSAHSAPLVTDPSLNPKSRLSFMERAVLLECRHMPNSGKFLRVFDLEFEHLELEGDIWKQILHQVVLKHHELHKHYIITDHDYDAVIVSKENIKVDIEIIPSTKLGKHDPRDDIVFDLTNHLPIKFQIALNSKTTILRTILHAVITDLASVILIVKDMQGVAAAILNGEKIPTATKTTYIAPTIHTIVNKKIPASKSFWTKQLENVKEPVTLGKGILIYPLDRNRYRLVKGSFPVAVSNAVFEFLKTETITVFQFFISIFQLFLYLETDSVYSHIPVVSPTDMRIHSKDLVTVVGRCVNDIPFIANFEERRSFRQFLVANAKSIQLAVENSAYPFQLILNEIALEKVQQNIGRHRFVLDNMSELGQIIQNNDTKVSIKNLWTTSDEFETYLSIAVDPHLSGFLYEFGYNSAVYNRENGDLIPEKIISLMKRCITGLDEGILSKENKSSTSERNKYKKIQPLETNLMERSHGESNGTNKNVDPSTQVSHIPGHKDVKMIVDGSAVNNMGHQLFDTVMKKGTVRKQTRHGWNHKVQLTFKREKKEPSGRATYRFEWVNSRKHKLRSIPLHCIREVTYWPADLNGFHALVMHKESRKFVMKIDTEEEAKDWMEIIKKAVEDEFEIQD